MPSLHYRVLLLQTVRDLRLCSAPLLQHRYGDRQNGDRTVQVAMDDSRAHSPDVYGVRLPLLQSMA